MDAKNLYPSLKIEEVVKIVGEVIDESKITFEDIYYRELAKYLKIKVSKADIKKHKINKFLPKHYTNWGDPTVRYLIRIRYISRKMDLMSKVITSSSSHWTS